MNNIELLAFVNPEVYYFGSILNLHVVLGFHSYCNGDVQFHVITMFKKWQSRKVSAIDLSGHTNQYLILVHCVLMILISEAFFNYNSKYN